jgi:hypothetical protein
MKRKIDWHREQAREREEEEEKKKGRRRRRRRRKPNRHFMASVGRVWRRPFVWWNGEERRGEILRWSVGSRQRVLTHADISVVYLQRSGPFQGSASSLLFLSHFISVEFLFCFYFYLFFSRAKRKISERKEKRKKNKITQDRVNQTKWCLTYSLSFSGWCAHFFPF